MSEWRGIKDDANKGYFNPGLKEQSSEHTKHSD